MLFASGVSHMCQCIKVGTSQDQFDDEITFRLLDSGTCTELKNGSISDNSSRPFRLNHVYTITRLPGLALKFEIKEAKD